MFEQTIESTLHQQPRVLILRMGKVPFMDSTGEAYFSNIIENYTAQGGTILVTGVQGDLKDALQHNGLYDKIGAHFSAYWRSDYKSFPLFKRQSMYWLSALCFS